MSIKFALFETAATNCQRHSLVELAAQIGKSEFIVIENRRSMAKVVFIQAIWIMGSRWLALSV